MLQFEFYVVKGGATNRDVLLFINSKILDFEIAVSNMSQIAFSGQP